MIVWSDEARINYETIIDELLKKWPVHVASDFEERTNDILDKLLQYKQLCPLIQYKNLRKCVIHRNASLIYKVSKNKIELITFIFNRDNHRYYHES